MPNALSEILKQHRKTLISTLNGDNIFVESLFVNNVINERQYELIKAEKVPYQATEKILDFVKHSGLYGFISFCEILDENYSWLADELKNAAQNNGIIFDVESIKEQEATISFPVGREHAVPSERELMKISKSLVRCDWESILYDLGLQTSNIDQCKQSHPMVVMQCMSGLIFWLRKYGKSATYKILYTACVNADVDRNCLFIVVEFASNIASQ